MTNANPKTHLRSFKAAVIIQSALLISLAHAQESHWRPLTPMPTRRYGHAAAVLDGKIYVLGGRKNDHRDPLDVVEVYDPASDTWDTAIEPLHEKRMNAAAVSFGGRVFVIGGREGDDVLKETEVYDPGTGHWENGPELKRGREGLAAVVFDSTIYVVGGLGDNGNPVSGAEYLDRAEGKWKTSPRWELLIPRVAMSTVVVGETAFTMGGVSLVPIADVEDFNIANGAARSSPMTRARANFAAGVVGDSIYIFGGFGNSLGAPGLIHEVERFVPATGAWATVASLEEPRQGLAAAVVNRRFYLFGGRSGDGEASGLSHEFSPVVTSVASRPGSPPRRFELRQNYPNPFSSAEAAIASGSGIAGGDGTVLSFVLNGTAPVAARLEIINLRGQVVRTIVDDTLPPGEHSARWDGRDEAGRTVAGGLYLYRLTAGGEQQVRKMTVLR